MATASTPRLRQKARPTPLKFSSRSLSSPLLFNSPHLFPSVFFFLISCGLGTRASWSSRRMSVTGRPRVKRSCSWKSTHILIHVILLSSIAHLRIGVRDGCCVCGLEVKCCEAGVSDRAGHRCGCAGWRV